MTNPLSKNTADFFGMPYNRYDELQWGTGPAQLTDDEIAMGWHWCLEWDDMLIHPAMEEYANCTCEGCEAFAEKARKRRDALDTIYALDELLNAHADPVNPEDAKKDLKHEADANNEEFRKGDMK